ncbi:MAG TPA: PCRF domain-containing protein, partial [Armatimonadota bacterium]|nr:PCRF domain-containing protein [Armatimonadota bacterium]
MWDRFDDVEARFERLTQELGDPSVVSDSARLQQVAKQHAELEPLVTAYREFKDLRHQVADARELLKDPEMRDMAEEELRRLESRRETLEKELKRLILPKDPNDEKDVMVEIRAG